MPLLSRFVYNPRRCQYTRGVEVSKVRFTVNESADFTLVSFEIDGVMGPEDLVGLNPPKVAGSKGVVLSGRGPIWLYGFLIHFYHITAFVAIYDPRLEGAVVVETHSERYRVGSVLRCAQS
jgi:CRISPR-associated protein Csx3